MRVAIIRSGVVENVVNLPDNTVIAGNASTATIPAEMRVTHPDGTANIEEYEAIFDQGGESILVATDTAGPGWTYDGGQFAAA